MSENSPRNREQGREKHDHRAPDFDQESEKRGGEVKPLGPRFSESTTNSDI